MTLLRAGDLPIGTVVKTTWRVGVIAQYETGMSSFLGASDRLWIRDIITGHMYWLGETINDIKIQSPLTLLERTIYGIG